MGSAISRRTLLTESEIRTVRNKTFKRLREISKIIDDFKIGTDQEKKDEISLGIRYVYDVYYCLDNVTILQSQTFRKDVVKFMIELKLFDIFVSTIENYRLKDVPPEPEWLSYMSSEWPSYMSFIIIQRYIDESDDLAKRVYTTPVLESCKKLLETYVKDHIQMKLSTERNTLVNICSEIVHNASKVYENVERIRTLGFTKTLMPYYMKSPYVSLRCLKTISNIVNDEECVIRINKDTVSSLLKTMEFYTERRLQTCESERRSCEEYAQVVRKLAVNDANKQALLTMGAIPLLVDLATSGDLCEKYEAVLALWTLAFDKHITEYIVTTKDNSNDDKKLDVIDTLLKVKQESVCNGILEETCERCLWTLKEKLLGSPIPCQKFREAAEGMQLKASAEKTKGQFGDPTGHMPEKRTEKHVMISYQKGNRDIMIKIKNELKAQNYKVWMDLDNMGGSTLEAMANAVEDSFVFLMCYSRSYKNSRYCRSEAEYAYHLNKPIIPLKMEEGYKPDGWLGLILGALYFVEFSEKYPFEDKLKDLFKEIKSVEEKLPGTVKDVQRNRRTATNSENTDITDAYTRIHQTRKWNQLDLKYWLKRHDLNGQGFDSITGEEISLLAQMQIETPDDMYQYIQKKLKVKELLMTARLVWALYDIASGQNREFPVKSI